MRFAPRSLLANFRAGSGTLLTRRGELQLLSVLPSSTWRHPWFTQPSWSPNLRQWTATILAGFVNELTPAYRATVDLQKSLGNVPNGRVWDINPLTGKPFFSADIFNPQTGSSVGEPVPAGVQTVDVPLYLNPAIPLAFYSLGFDGDGSRAVPQFFLNLGVAKTPQQPSIDDLLSGNADVTDAPQAPPNLRLLRACDLWVHQPRVALTSSMLLNPAGYLTGQATVLQTLGVALPDPSDRVQVIAGEFVPDTQQIDPLASDYEEPTFDQILISTVYLLSPPNTAPNSSPDSTWIPYVRHNLFWNLNWAQPAFHQPAVDTEDLTIPPLAAGAATLVISSFNAEINNLTQQALDIINAASLAGTFWTPTGGGHEITPPPAPPAPRLTLNIYENAAAKLAAQQTALRSQTLEPSFPYGAQSFDPTLLQSA